MKFSVLSNQVKHHHQGQTLYVMSVFCKSCEDALKGFSIGLLRQCFASSWVRSVSLELVAVFFVA